MDPNGTDEAGRPSRILPGLTSISQTLQKTIITITEPLSPSKSDFDAGASSTTPGLSERLRIWINHRKDGDIAPSISTPEATIMPRTLMTLPDELQILILSFLKFGDIERLRHTSKYWYNFATPRLMRTVWGPDLYRALLTQHCRVCLAHCPVDVARIATSCIQSGYPLSSRCLPCTVQSRDGTVRIGRKVMLGNFLEFWTCRWCGWPITEDTSTGHVQFHRGCYDKYALVLLAFFCLGWLQFCIGVVAAGMSWHYFKHDTIVVAPTALGFVLTWVCIILIMFRGNRVRTYHWALLIELAIVGLWVSTLSFLLLRCCSRRTS